MISSPSSANTNLNAVGGSLKNAPETTVLPINIPKTQSYIG